MGHYNGSVVVLDEPAPVDHEVKVTVHFPVAATEEPHRERKPKRWHWEESRAALAGVKGSVSEELRRQRDLE